MRFHGVSGLTNSWIKTSTDTVTGLDGTWTLADQPQEWNDCIEAKLRTLKAVTWTGIKAIEFGNMNSYIDLYIYNFNIWSNFTNTTGLIFWDGTNDQIMNGDNFDIGDTLPSSVVVREFRVKNAHTQTANTITVSAPTGYANTGSLRVGLEFSTDGTNYSSSVVIAPLDIGAGRVMTVPQSWT